MKSKLVTIAACATAFLALTPLRINAQTKMICDSSNVPEGFGSGYSSVVVSIEKPITSYPLNSKVRVTLTEKSESRLNTHNLLYPKTAKYILGWGAISIDFRDKTISSGGTSLVNCQVK